MRPLSETLTDLISFAEDIVGKPAKYRTFLSSPTFSTIAAEIRHAEALPAEGIRTTEWSCSLRWMSSSQAIGNLRRYG
jgi:hypothetical protein